MVSFFKKFIGVRSFTLSLLTLMTITFLLTGCGGRSMDGASSVHLYAKRGSYKIGKPYEVKGVTYTPEEDFDYDATGYASWYGPGFHGKTTANMEIFDQNEVSAAHKTLQLPCLVRVRNLENGRELDIRVNDRGPFYDGRIIDLSKRAAQLLGVFQKGLARVRVKVLKTESLVLRDMAKGKITSPPMAPTPVIQDATLLADKQKPTGSSKKTVSSISLMDQGKCSSQCYVTAGEFKNFSEAARASAKLDPVGKTKIIENTLKGARFYSVHLGPYQGESGGLALKKIQGMGFSKSKIIGK